MGTAFVKGLQGADKKYLKTSACAKHFAVHSGPEAGRHSFNAVVDEKDLRETYQYFTEATMQKIREAGYDQPFYSLENGVGGYVREYLSKGKFY